MSQRGQTETKAKHPFVLAAAAAVREQIRAIFDDAVVRALTAKVAPGGIFVLEFPSPRSLTLPSMRGTLNFHDDETHVRLWTRAEIGAALEAGGLRVIASGRRRDLFRLLATPVRVLWSQLRHGWVPGSAFWDLLGFADAIVAERPRN